MGRGGNESVGRLAGADGECVRVSKDSGRTERAELSKIGPGLSALRASHPPYASSQNRSKYSAPSFARLKVRLLLTYKDTKDRIFQQLRKGKVVRTTFLIGVHRRATLGCDRY